MNETWISNKETSNLDINGYCAEHICGNKSKNTTRGRFSGGISFYFRSELKQYISVVESNQYGIIWIKISKELFPFDDDVFICHIYIPPSISKVFWSTDFDFFEQIEIDIVKYNDMGKVYVCGDFNSRTSDLLDYFVFDKYLDEHLSDMLSTCYIPIRSNMDRIIDTNGIRLLETCQATGLLLANGRLGNDENKGQFTFCSHTGQSTVDYLMTNFCDFTTISCFEIQAFNEYSDHAPILFKMHTKPCTNPHQQHEQQSKNITRKIVWDKSKIQQFKVKLANEHDVIQTLTNEAPTEDIDHVVQRFTRFMHDNAFDVFGKTYTDNVYTGQRNKPQNDWFDENCSKARDDFKTARNSFNRTKNDQDRIEFTKARTRYNRTRRKAKYKFKQREGQRISKLAKSDSKKFWKSIRSMYKKKSETADSLHIDDLFNHLSTMFGENDTENVQTDNLENDMPQNIADEFGSDFSESEIREAIFSQKENKSPGIDNLTSEILKASYDYIAPFLLTLYNRLLNNGEYPRAWGEGIITPIFKKGDVNDASNYRGITLINILAKVYSQLLLNRVTKWSEVYEKITKNQFGFQKGKSISDCIFLLHSVISKVLNSKQKLYCVFIDYEKCFDKIDRSLLWHKLLSEHLNCKLVRAIKSMYNTVKSCVRYKSSYSSFFSSTIGLKQGDLLLFIFQFYDWLKTR